MQARPPVLGLHEVRPEDRGKVGGKAAGLAVLLQGGLPVPPGFVVCAETGDDARAAAAEAYRALGGRVAVRSSGTAEDLESASFAGQYESVLDVAGEDAVLDALARVRASGHAASAYASAMGAPRGAMAVLVQRFVEPRAAGVVFTRHPEQADKLLVEAHAGRGEAVVSGRVTPTAYVVDRRTRASFEVPGAPGPLSADELQDLVALAFRAEERFGAPQDVEWALGEAGFVLLQSRPISVEAGETLPPGARRLTRANVGEVLPGPIAPLSWSSVVAFLEGGFQGVARRAGLLAPDMTGPFLVHYRQRVYLNLSLCLEVGMRLPGVTLRDAERLVLGQGDGRAEHSRLPPLRAWPRLLGVGLRLLGIARRLPGEIEQVERHVRALPDRAAIAAAPFEALPGLLYGFLDAGDRVAQVHIGASGACGFRLALLQGLLARVPGDPVDLANRLLAGLDGVESVRPTLALEALAAELRARPEDARAFLDSGGTRPAELASRLAAFLDEFGHRALSEADLASPAWEDDPGPVLDALRSLVADRRPAGFSHAARAAARAADVEAVVHRLGPLAGALFGRFLGAATAAVRERERTKSLAVRVVAHGRRLVSRSARELCARGLLAAPADVHFLTVNELEGLFAGRLVAVPLVARRRRIHERESRLEAPREVDRDRSPTEASPGAERLSGTGVSAGIGVGPARVLAAGARVELQPGEVLVAPVLDAALGPLLVSAAGAVVEMGGMLSHGAVVARELGVPCVVDVRGATSRLRDGQRVLVDGNAGRVEVLAKADAAAGSEPGDVLPPADPADEALHVLEADSLARESVYFNAFDPRTGLGLVASQGVRPAGRGEAVVALLVPGGRVLFALDIEPARRAASGFGVGGLETSWAPPRLRFRGRLASAEAKHFPPGPLPLLLAPRSHEVELDLSFEATTPAIDMAEALPPELRSALEPLGRHHVEQSGRFRGRLVVDGRALAVEATGSRDHSWGLRDWSAADHWRLFSGRLGDDLAFHALSVSCRGRRVAGGFLWDGRRATALQRVEHSAETREGRLTGFDLEITTRRGERHHLRGDVAGRLTIPVQPETRLLALIGRGAFALRLHENFTRYRLGDRVGHGIAEFTERST